MTQIKAGDRALIGYFSGIDEDYWGKECTLIGIIDNIYKVEIDGKIIECSKRDLDEIPLTDPELKPGMAIVFNDKYFYEEMKGVKATFRGYDPEDKGYCIIDVPGYDKPFRVLDDVFDIIPFSPIAIVSPPDQVDVSGQEFMDKAMIAAMQAWAPLTNCEGAAKNALDYAKALLLIRNQNLVK